LLSYIFKSENGSSPLFFSRKGEKIFGCPLRNQIAIEKGLLAIGGIWCTQDLIREGYKNEIFPEQSKIKCNSVSCLADCGWDLGL
jgi:hypothetical protein